MNEQTPTSAEREPAEEQPDVQPEAAGAPQPPAPGGGNLSTHAQEVRHTSAQEDPTALSEGLGDAATGDRAIDKALEDLKDAAADDLDAQIAAGEQVNDTLKSRLSDLGGE